MGAGMGLTLAPAADSIMGALPAEQAGVGSAINDTVQELGGSRRRRHRQHRRRLVPSRARAPGGAREAGHSPAVQDAFTNAMSTGFTLAAAVAVAGALAAYAFLPREREAVRAAIVTA